MTRATKQPRGGRSGADLDEQDRLLREALQERIREALPDEKAVRVEVKRGQVVLRGDVDTPAAARRAKAACRGVDGVGHITDHLRPRTGAGGA